MKAKNERWAVWHRHCDDQIGILRLNGSVVYAIEALQRSWAKEGKRTGCTYQVVQGGEIDALHKAAKWEDR